MHLLSHSLSADILLVLIWILPSKVHCALNFLEEILHHILAVVHLFTILFPVSQVADLKSAMDILEKERDFYFAKLRDIEILCQAPEVMNLSMSVAVKKILYAEDAKESALDEAQDYLNQTMNAIEAEAEIESNYSQN